MRTTFTIDDELFQEAAEQLGTHGRSETVNRALEEVVATHRRHAAAAMLDELELDLSEENMQGAWR